MINEKTPDPDALRDAVRRYLDGAEHGYTRPLHYLGEDRRLLGDIEWIEPSLTALRAEWFDILKADADAREHDLTDEEILESDLPLGADVDWNLPDTEAKLAAVRARYSAELLEWLG